MNTADLPAALVPVTDRDPMSPTRWLSNDERRRLAERPDWSPVWDEWEARFNAALEDAEANIDRIVGGVK